MATPNLEAHIADQMILAQWAQSEDVSYESNEVINGSSMKSGLEIQGSHKYCLPAIEAEQEQDAGQAFPRGGYP